MTEDEDREKLYLEMIEQVPDSALPWFSLGRSTSRAATTRRRHALRRCTQLQANYAAALFALGEAWRSRGPARGSPSGLPALPAGRPSPRTTPPSPKKRRRRERELPP